MRLTEHQLRRAVRGYMVQNEGRLDEGFLDFLKKAFAGLVDFLFKGVKEKTQKYQASTAKRVKPAAQATSAALGMAPTEFQNLDMEIGAHQIAFAAVISEVMAPDLQVMIDALTKGAELKSPVPEGEEDPAWAEGGNAKVLADKFTEAVAIANGLSGFLGTHVPAFAALDKKFEADPEAGLVELDRLVAEFGKLVTDSGLAKQVEEARAKVESGDWEVVEATDAQEAGSGTAPEAAAEPAAPGEEQEVTGDEEVKEKARKELKFGEPFDGLAKEVATLADQLAVQWETAQKEAEKKAEEAPAEGEAAAPGTPAGAPAPAAEALVRSYVRGCLRG